MKSDWQIVVILIRFLILEKEGAMKFEIKIKKDKIKLIKQIRNICKLYKN